MTATPTTPQVTAARTVGASDVPVILGLSPYVDASPFKLWARLTGRDDHRDDNTAAQARGLMFEPGILLRIGRETGLHATHNDARIHSSADALDGGHLWRHATPDGFGWKEDPFQAQPQPQATATLEAKALRFLDGWGDHGTDQVRTDYMAQVVWQMACTGLPCAYVGAFGLYHDDWRLFEVKRDLMLEGDITERVRAWWDAYVVADKSPPLDGKAATARSLARVYGKVVGEHVEANASDLDLIRRVRTLDDHLRERKARREQLANQVRERIGDAHKLVSGKKTLARWTLHKSGTRALTIIRETST